MNVFVAGADVVIGTGFVPKETLAAGPGGGWTGDAGVGFVKTLDAPAPTAAAAGSGS